MIKNPPANTGEAGDSNLIPGLGKSPGGENGNPLHILPEESHGQRSLAGYSPWGGKESDMTLQNKTTQDVLYFDYNVCSVLCGKVMCILLYVIYTAVDLNTGPSKTKNKKTDAERPFKGLLE